MCQVTAKAGLSGLIKVVLLWVVVRGTMLELVCRTIMYWVASNT